MPYPNEHAARLRDPGDFAPDSFRRTNGGKLNGKDVPESVSVIWGKMKDAAGEGDPMMPQALRFDKTKWTAEAARKWCADNEIKMMDFEPASEDEPATSARDDRLVCLYAPGDAGLKVDREAGVIRNVSVITAGAANPGNDVDFDVDGEMLAQTAAAINASPVGIESRVTHVEQQGSAFSPAPDSIFYSVGRVKNARVADGHVRADVHLHAHADDSPVGKLRTFLMGKAEQDPTGFGMSIMFRKGAYVSRPNSVPLGRLASLNAVDFVGKPGANPNGLLSGGGQPPLVGGHKMPENPDVKDVQPEPVASAPVVEPVALAAPAPKPDDKTALQRAAEDAVAAERKRRQDIVALAVANEMPDGWARDLADRGVTLAQATELVILAKEMKPVAVKVGEDRNLSTLGGAMTDAICLRAGVKIEKPHERAQKMVGLGVVDLFRQYLTQFGCTDAMYLSRPRIVDLLSMRQLRNAYPSVALAMSTSDFTEILRDAINKSLMQAYAEAPKQWNQWARMSTAADFKTIYRASLSEAPNLTARTEGGEIRYVSLSEMAETYALAEYAGGLRLTRRMLVNDDMDAFNRLPQMQALAAVRKEDDVAFAILTANANMADGGALFNTTAVTTTGGHANQAAAGVALSVVALSAGAAAMGLQKGPKLAAYLNLQPRWLLVPVTKRILAEQLIGSVNDPAITAPTTNPFANKLGVIANARLDANSTTGWYLLADTALIDTVEVCFLQGEETPVLAQETDFDTDDVKYKVRHTVAAKAIDWRGMYRNTGA